MNQYIYTLKLIPRLIDNTQWTAEDNEIVNQHFINLQNLLAEGKLILAGRTLNDDETKFGIVIFEANTINEAQTIMLNDPTVKAGIMIAELFPYRVALKK